MTEAPPGTPVSMMTDFELKHEIEGGSRDAADELAARRQDRRHVRDTGPQTAGHASHSGTGAPQTPRRPAGATLAGRPPGPRNSGAEDTDPAETQRRGRSGPGALP
jgi:hypothetical protein